MKKVEEFEKRWLWLICTAAASLGQGAAAMAQEAAPQTPTTSQSASNQDPSQPIEEVVATGRFLSASQIVANERLEDASVVDTLGADAISRLGDSTVAAALRRVPGLSLVADKYVYVRGLGERYSATTLNGANVPSPDLTRNVIPLDVFPTSVIESLRVQKAWAPDLPANFGGGSVDIRTKGIPNEFEFNFEVGSGANSITPSSVYTYNGGGDDNLGSDDGTRALSPQISSALAQYQGNIGVQNILTILRSTDSTATLADAQAINRGLALHLNRDIAFEKKSPAPDGSLRTSVGSNFQLNDNWDLGFLAGASYQNNWRQTTSVARNFSFPQERTDTKVESVHAVDMSGNVNLGVRFTEDHELSVTSLYLRNTDDKTTLQDFFNENRQISDGLGFRNYLLRFEERNLRTNQIAGTHYLGAATRETFPALGRLLRNVPEEVAISWFDSESKATTSIPNEVAIASQTVTDPVTAAVLDEAVALQSSAADYRFTDLADRVNSYGWSISWPMELARSTLELKGGSSHSEKARNYGQTQFSLGPISVTDVDVLSGSLNDVFSDANILDPANNFVFGRQGTNNQSYLAATMTDAIYGMVDWTFDQTWRITGGARWEDYRQAAVDWNPHGYSEASPQVTTDPDALKRGTFAEDKIYPAASFTYMGDFWAETFQLRVGVSKTAVRPDLREITDASYLDPITNDLVRGNSGVVPADVSNLDIRAEWFFDSGDSFTATYFKKDIDKPIEFFESAASDTTIAREILNAESAEVHGLEIEGPEALELHRTALRAVLHSGQPDAAGFGARGRPPARRADESCAADGWRLGLRGEPDVRLRLEQRQAHGLSDLQRVRRALVRGGPKRCAGRLRAAVQVARLHVLVVSERYADR